MLEQAAQLNVANLSLEKARDLLLPKLMSGQLDVSGIPLPENLPGLTDPVVIFRLAVWPAAHGLDDAAGPRGWRASIRRESTRWPEGLFRRPAGSRAPPPSWAQTLGWQAVFAQDDEDFGEEPAGPQQGYRGGAAPRGAGRPAAPQPGPATRGYSQALAQVLQDDITKTLVALNQEKYTLLREGVPVYRASLALARDFFALNRELYFIPV